MKEFQITVGGSERRLRYTSKDGVLLYQRFGKPLHPLIRDDALGLGRDGKPTRETRPDVQVALLFLGLRHDLPRLTEDQLSEWIDLHLEEGGDLADLVSIASKAAYYSGIVLGRRLDIDEESERTDEQLGKATAAKEAGGEAPAIPAAE